MRRYVEALFRHPILLTLPLVVAVAASVAYVTSQPQKYRGGLSFWCDTPIPNPSSVFDDPTGPQPADRHRAVLGELLQTQTFLTKVARASPWAEQLDRSSGTNAEALLQRLARNVGVSTAGPHVLAVSTRGATPTEALELARAIGVAYVTQVNETQHARARSSLGYYHSDLDQANKALSEARARLTQQVQTAQGGGPLGVAGDAAVAQLTQQLSTAQANYEKAKSNVAMAEAGLSAAGDSDAVRVFDEPDASEAPIGRRKKLVFAGAAGGFAGMMVSFVTLLLLVVGDRSVHGAADVESMLRMPVVGTIEELRHKRPRRKAAS